MAASAALFMGSRRAQLRSDEPLIVPAGDAVLIIDDLFGQPIRLNGRLLDSSDRARLVLPLKLTRSTGYHRLDVGLTNTFWFASEDAKLALDGVESMLRSLGNTSLQWQGQIYFSDGSLLRDPRVVMSWLEGEMDSLISQASSIARSPVREMRTRRLVSNPGSSRADVPATFKLIRRRGLEILEDDTTGPIEIDSLRFSPRQVVVRARTRSIATVANLRLVSLLLRMLSLVDEVRAANDPSFDVMQRTGFWKQQILRLLESQTLRELEGQARQTIDHPTAPSAVEIADRRYAHCYRLWQKLQREFGWSASAKRLDRYGYVAYADRIYQAFAANQLAQALELHPTDPVLGRTQPAYTGPSWDLYYDCSPPKNVIRSWRSHTHLSDHLRPDILLVNKANGAVILGDAKYRNDGAEGAESGRKELESYMSAFGISSCFMVYPVGKTETLRMQTAEYRERTLVEISVRPDDNLSEFLHSQIPRLLSLAQRPTY